VQEWARVLGDYRKTAVMNNRKIFQEDIWRRLQEADPVLASVLRYELVFVLLNETKPMKEVYYEANRIVDEKQGSLIPIDEILRLEQKRLITEARTYLPLWKSIPLIGRLGVYLGKLLNSFKREPKDSYRGEAEAAGAGAGARQGSPERTQRGSAGQGDAGTEDDGGGSGGLFGLFGGGKKESAQGKGRGAAGSSGAAGAAGAAGAREGRGTAHAGTRGPSGGGAMVMDTPGSRGKNKKEELKRRREYRKAVARLASQYLEEGKDVDTTLDELIEEWNPLMSTKAKNDLVEDVNSAVRDFLRKIRRKIVTPPDRHRIRNLASQIAEYEAFTRIKNKKAFQKYIELYMLKVLGQ
jgi:hypothetical protein